MNLPAWSVRNRVAVNLFTIVCLIAGFFAGFVRLERDLFPDVSTNFISITTIDPASSIPEDIERTITVPIEEELGNVDGLEEIRSVSQDNFSQIFIEVDPAIENLEPILNEVRQAVDIAQQELPSTAEPPVVEQFDIPMPLVNFTVAFPPGFDIRTVRPVLDRIERRLKITPGVSKVLVDGLEDREVWIELDPFRMQSLNISFEEIAQAVSRRNISAAGGRLDGAGGQRVVRIVGEVKSAEELEDMPIRVRGASTVFLRDIATIKETMEEEETKGRVNLRSAVTYTVVKKRGADAIETAKAAKAVFNEERKMLPEELETQIVSDSTKYIDTRVETVLQNGFQALVLVTLLLMLLLDWRSALLVALGIPFSVAGCFLIMYFNGYSVNLLSLFAMIMALGMVVDDAIVSCENIFRYYQQGFSPAEAAIRGAREIIWPVLGSVSTTVAAFLPLIWGEGIIGKFLAVVPVVVIAALGFSLVEAFLVLPSHAGDFLKPIETPESLRARAAREKPRGKAWIFHQVGLTYAELRALTESLLVRVREIYVHLLILSLRKRYLVILIFFGAFFAMIVALRLNVVRFQLFAVDFADSVIVKVELPADTSIEETERIVARLENRIVEVLPKTDYVALLSRIGTQLDATNQFLDRGSNLAMITVDLDEQSDECRKPSLIERDLRKLLYEFPEFVRAEAAAEQGGPPVGRAVNMQIRGPEFDVLKQISAEARERLAGVSGVVNISDDFPRGKTELRVLVDEGRAARVGVDVTGVGRTLQAAFRGLEAASLRWGNDEVVLRVKMDERYAHDPELLSTLRVPGSEGRTVDLSSVAEIRRASGYSRITRINQERVLTVSGDVDDRVTTSAMVNNVIKEWIPELLKDRPGYSIVLSGENEDTERSLGAMQFAALVALLLIYGILATISNSFVQPLVIMAVIPFGIVGVFLGLIFMGEPMGLMSIMGTIALAGIVVNNSVVLVDFINRYRHQHGGAAAADQAEIENIREQPRNLSRRVRWRSIISSGHTRFRPIILTSATTVAGLMSLALTRSGQEQFLAPMAQAIVWGLSFATLITLVLIPCLYAVLDDILVWREKRRNRKEMRPRSLEV